MLKLRELKVIALAVVIAFSFQNLTYANPDLFAKNNRQASDTLAPEGRFQNYGVEAQSLMFLVRAAQEVLAKNIRPEKVTDFIKNSPALTPEIEEKIDFGLVNIVGDKSNKLQVGYRGEQGTHVITFSEKPEHIRGRMPDSAGRVQIANIIVEIDVPSKGIEQPGQAPEGGARDTLIDEAEGDITGASEGDTAIHSGKRHEGKKQFRGIFGIGYGRWLAKKVSGVFGKWYVKREPGVNDVIRKYWRKGKPLKGCSACSPEEMSSIMAAIYATMSGKKVGTSIIANVYKVYIYDIGRRDFSGGVTTHFGIRTGTIHITKEEYERLKKLDEREHEKLESSDEIHFYHLAARIAHEVTEIDSWRKKAKDLVAEKAIDRLGSIKSKYSDDWANGIRKWIRDNCNTSGKGAAQRLDREFHRKGFDREACILAESLLAENILARKGISDKEKYYETVMKLSREFLENGKYDDLVADLGSSVRIPRGKRREAFDSIVNTLKHFDDTRGREVFINVLYAKASFEYIRALDGGVDSLLQKDWSFKDKSRGLARRMDILRESLEKVKYIDSVSREEIETWIDETGTKIRVPPPGIDAREVDALISIFMEVRKLLSGRNHMQEWDKIYPSVFGPEDPAREPDIIGASDPGESPDIANSDPKGPEDTIRAPSPIEPDEIKIIDFGLGEMKSEIISESISPQNGPVKPPMDTDAVLNILEKYKNWNYRSVKGRSTEKREMTTGRSRMKDTSRKQKETSRKLETTQETAGYKYISRFSDDAILREKVKKARGSARDLMNNPLILRLTEGSRDFRMYYGSSTGYFDVLDVRKDYPHILDITILVDGKRDPILRAYGQEEIKKISEGISAEFSDVNRFNLTVVGIEDMREAFRKGSSMSSEKSADLQRLFIKLYKEDIQIAGSNLIDESSGFLSELDHFERIYIAELVSKFTQMAAIREDMEGLERHIGLSADEKQELKKLRENHNKTKLKIGELETQQERVNNAMEALDGKRKQLTGDPKKIKEATRKILAGEEVSEDEAGPLGEVVAELAGRIISGEKVPEDEFDRMADDINRAVADFDIDKFNQQVKTISREANKVADELTKLNGLLKREEELRIREQGVPQRLARLEFERYKVDRDCELLCKKIEDAQSGRPLTQGIVINNRYIVMEKLGQGGFGAVYRVLNKQTGQEKALKIILPTRHMDLSTRMRTMAAFNREVESHNSLCEIHAQVPVVEARGGYAGSPYFVMSLEKGLTLKEIHQKLVNGSLRLSMREKLILMHAVMKAVATIHSGGYIHRDLKPENIMIPANEDGTIAFPGNIHEPEFLASTRYDAFVRRVTILDLGRAVRGEKTDEEDDIALIEDINRTMVTGQFIVGTPHFMAPEQFKKEAISSFADVYALGITFYLIFSHHYPIADGERMFAVIASKHVDMELAPEPLCEIIERENERLRQVRAQNRLVDKKRLDAIREDLTDALVAQKAPDRRVIIVSSRRDGRRRMQWLTEVLDESILRERLARMQDPDSGERLVTDEEIDRIVALVILKLPQTDGLIEALIQQMLEKYQGGRPTTEDVIQEMEKYLTDRKDAMIYRSRDEKIKEEALEGVETSQDAKARLAGVNKKIGELTIQYKSETDTTKKAKIRKLLEIQEKKGQVLEEAATTLRREGSVVRAAKWLQNHTALLAAVAAGAVLLLAAIVATLVVLYRSAVSERQAARKAAETAKAERTKALEDKEKALKEVVVAESRLQELNKIKEELSGSLLELEQKKGTALKEQATLSEQIKDLKERAEKAAELEETILKLEEQEKALKQKEKELNEKVEKTETGLKEKTAALEKAQKELARYRESMPGVFEDAKAKAAKLEADEAIHIIEVGGERWWWSIDETTLKQFTLGFDEVSRIMVNNGQFDEAIRLEERRIDWLVDMADWRDTEAEKLSFVKEIIKSQVAVINIHRAKGSYDAAEKLAKELMNKNEYKASKEWMELLRDCLIEVVLENAALETIPAKRQQKLLEAEKLVKQVESEEKRNLHLGNIFLIRPDLGNALKYFETYYNLWLKKAGEEGISAGVKNQRQHEAAQGILLSAVTHKMQAEIHKGKNDPENMEKACDAAEKLLEKIVKEFAKDKDIQAWALFLKGETARLKGDLERSKGIYEQAEFSAHDTEQKLLAAIICARLGKKIAWNNMTKTWEALISGKIPVPAPYIKEVKELLVEGTEKYRKGIEDAKRRAEEERIKEELRKKQEAEAKEIRKEALEGVEKAKDAENKLVQINSEIAALEAALDKEQDESKRKDIQKQLDRAKKKKQVLGAEKEKLEKQEAESKAREEFRKKVLEGIKTSKDAKVRLVGINKEIGTLTGNLRTEENKSKRAQMEKQLQEAKEKKKILEEARDRLEKEEAERKAEEEFRKEVLKNVKTPADAEAELTKINAEIGTLKGKLGATEDQPEKEEIQKQLDRAEKAKKVLEEEKKALEEREAEAERKAEEEFRKEVLKDIKTLAEAKARLEGLNKDIGTLTDKLSSAKDEEKAEIESGLEKAKKTKQVLEEAIKKLEEARPEKETPDPDKTPEPGKKDASQSGMAPVPQIPIANDVSRAPDHRLLNAVIKCAIDEALFDRLEKRDDDTITVFVFGDDSCRNFGDVYERLENKVRVSEMFKAACRADSVPSEIMPMLHETGMANLHNVSGHAGIENSTIYAVKGVPNLEVLINHEKEEMRIHQKHAAGFAGLGSWEEVPKIERRGLIQLMRKRGGGCNVFAMFAHKRANKKFPVSGNSELIPDSMEERKLADTIGKHYQVPVAGGAETREDLTPGAALKALLGIVKKISGKLVSSFAPAPVKCLRDRSRTDAGEGVIIFADDIVDHSAVFDLDRVAKTMGRPESILRTVVLYAKNAKKAELVAEIIKNANPKADVEMILDKDVREHYDEEYYSTSQVEAVVRYSMNRKSGIFTQASQILGVIRGPLSAGESEEALREELKRSSLRVPVVIFENSAKGNIYSVMQALAKLIERGRLSEDGWLFVLPPITRISDILQKEYELYRTMVKALEAAA